MKRLSVTALSLVLAAVTGVASAQSYSNDGYGSGYPNSYPASSGSQYDYARVLRVDPVFDNYSQYQGERCYERPTYVDGRNDGYYDDGYNDGYARRDDGYYDQYGSYRRNTGGTETGRTVATVIGGIVGAAVGSQVGGGSARYATSAIGSMVGGMAGRSIYEQNKRVRQDRVGSVRVCDPVRNTGYGDDRAVNAYDVTYEYAGRSYRTRTAYHPGDKIRVRVDVRPE
ncbi:glycine zipper 2TM domain-containing protein [Lysobacter silvisoli]|uniref:Glycine zipper 2TM domain-containing protein n=1 Tax=Lysobacter silvisoli TaxID=2293254 RepID=A0A371K638_9GAMM|nr:glycine zipper 2TM domain-containing protein [Lysobacter silvisoli]RDZ29324.1 hypothetical protein DX914_09645 [Lysobacter silvisoli]